MGRWPSVYRYTTEQCKPISTKFFKKHHYFDAGVHYGELDWYSNRKNLGGINFWISTIPGEEYIRLAYVYRDLLLDERCRLDYKIPLVATPCHFGGRRWWFICTLIINDRPCNRRVGVLYLGDQKYFGCRHCYSLTYASCRQSHKYDTCFRSMGITPEEAKLLFQNREI